VVSLVGGVVSLAERIAPDIQEVIERPAEENLDRRSAYERRCVVRPAQPAMLFIDCCDELPKIPEKPEHSRDAHEDVGFERQAFLRLRGLGTMSKLVLRRGALRSRTCSSSERRQRSAMTTPTRVGHERLLAFAASVYVVTGMCADTVPRCQPLARGPTRLPHHMSKGIAATNPSPTTMSARTITPFESFLKITPHSAATEGTIDCASG
jgi:hypothetical protein